jgi:hypothetical protein
MRSLVFKSANIDCGLRITDFGLGALQNWQIQVITIADYGLRIGVAAKLANCGLDYRFLFLSSFSCFDAGHYA